MPGTVVGTLTKAVQDEVGFNCKVVLPATHDTGSAVMRSRFRKTGKEKAMRLKKHMIRTAACYTSVPAPGP